MREAVYLNSLGIINALGQGRAAVAARLFAGDAGGMKPMTGFLDGRTVMAGAVAAALPEVPPEFLRFDSRNNRLLLAAVQEIEDDIRAAIDRYGADRVAVILGTSTSGISDNEAGVGEKVRTGRFPKGFDYDRQDNASLALFLRRYFGLSGLAMTISTACTSSAKTLASARRLMASGLCDAAIVGGADTLCRLTMNGFASLELVSDARCNPFSKNRGGINIGEGAAVFLMSREERGPRVAGIGETSDAHHMSTPDPDGTGAHAAMARALDDSGLNAADIGYLNLHGTATELNDSMEAKAVHQLLGAVPSSSTKPLTGHTLGAAGSTELAFLCLALESGEGLLPPHVWDGVVDPDLPPVHLVKAGERRENARAMMSNSFAFGGSNISVILTKD